MTIISLAAGGAYCIDQSEVSKGQYNKFITAANTWSARARREHADVARGAGRGRDPPRLGATAG